MIPVILAASVVLLGLGVAAAIGFLPTPPGVPEPVRDRRFEGLPDGPVDSAAVSGVRFDQVLRGYRMDQVDTVLRELGDQLDAQAAELARYRDLQPASPASMYAGPAGPGVVTAVPGAAPAPITTAARVGVGTEAPSPPPRPAVAELPPNAAEWIR